MNQRLDAMLYTLLLIVDDIKTMKTTKMAYSLTYMNFSPLTYTHSDTQPYSALEKYKF